MRYMTAHADMNQEHKNSTLSNYCVYHALVHGMEFVLLAQGADCY